MSHFAELAAHFDVEEAESKHGDGISRPVPGEPTELFRLLVRQTGVNPMKVLFQAETADKALAYGKARWPNAAVTLLDR